MKRLLSKIIKFFLKIFIFILITSVALVITYSVINPPISAMMVYKKVSEKNYTYKYDWIPIEEISPLVPLALISAEDQLFLTHNGFDIKAIENAISHNKDHKAKRGASTISQQVAKNLFLFPTKSILRKGIEAYFTVLIEIIWDKKRIMEVYLNIVELAEGRFGVNAISQEVFKKRPIKLNRANSALIATVLPNPITFDLKKPSTYMLKRQSWILKQMNNLGGETIISDWYE